MNRSLDALVDQVRERPVPWSPERAARVEQKVARGRARSEPWAPAARLAFGGLASVVLCASVVRWTRIVRDEPTAEREPALMTPAARAWGGAPEPDGVGVDRPLGDGGLADSGQ